MSAAGMHRVEQRTNAPGTASARPVLLTVPEACATLRVSRWTLYRLIHTRQLSTVKIGSRRLIPASALREFLDRLRERESG
jgi:excisionase family DNA binding protein